MTASLLALITAIFLRQPVTVPMVEAAGATVTVVGALPDPAWTGWIGCSETACEIKLVDPSQLRHEACHAADALSDGKMDGLIAGWRLWAGDLEAETGDYANDAERFAYWCSRQEVK